MSQERNKWMTKEILEITKKRQKTMPRERKEYQTLNREITDKCRQD